MNFYSQRVKSVCIVGGGTAGWITALTLRTYNPGLKVSLVQPKENKPIGVGESTQPDFMQLISDSELDLADMIANTDATMKCGIHYRNWNGDDQYWHPFTDLSTTSPFTTAHYHQYMIGKDDNFTHENYYKRVHPSFTICVENRKVDPNSASAIHLDAHKLSEYIQANLSGVTLLNEHEYLEVVTNPDGDVIEHLLLDDTIHLADLYIDCTGFSRALHSKVNKLPKYPYNWNVDSAFFAHVDYEDIEHECHPYTEAYAFEHGWMWAIPLTSRIGVGCVFARNSICDNEKVLDKFIERWDGRIDRDKVKYVEFESGQQALPWTNNVVGIGLSSGFIEPLEATGISWIVQTSALVSRVLSDYHYDIEDAEHYNTTVRNYINQIIDFVDVHYCLSKRRDSTMWEYNTSKGLHPRLVSKLDSYRAEMPNNMNRHKHQLWAFNEVSWLDILNGYEFKYDLDVHENLVIAAKSKYKKAVDLIDKLDANDYHCNTDFIKLNFGRVDK